MGSVIGRRQRKIIAISLLVGLMALGSDLIASGKLLEVKKVVTDSLVSPNKVKQRCLTPDGNDRRLGDAVKKRWSIDGAALGTEFDTTINCLVLRFNFQYEETNDPNTTGRGHMDLSRPLDTLTDSLYIEWVGHLVDPPPHDSSYFDAHLQALDRYWSTVSGNQIHLAWDIFPPARDSIYELPHPMSYYGSCDFSGLVEGLENYFVDGIRLADTTSPEIDFSQYDAVFLFHAGSDGQNDLGFPATCSDLFTGFIKFGGDVWVDDSTTTVKSALMMPETSVQDGRATALNAVLAHEFGHQLGLVDLYNTENFFTQLGDFALMDNNGFGTGIDFGWPVGRVFGAIPLYPSAWSRAFLGIDDVVDFRDDTTGIHLVAAELPLEPGLKIARIPITESEYYLAEVRVIETDNAETFVRADSATSVIQGPSDKTKTYTGEYDFLMPGSGMLIYHVDEAVAAGDHDGDGLNNFFDNDLQWYRDDRKFIRLVEANGLVHFGGNYYAGFGSQTDFFRDDLVTAITPNTNPATIDNSGNNTHLIIENIARERDSLSGARDDRYMTFDIAIDRKVDGFPIRAGRPRLGLAPIADDLDLTRDSTDELIMVAGKLLTVVTSSGENFIRTKANCTNCPPYLDTAITSINQGSSTNPVATYAVPLYAEIPALVTAGPVTGSVAGVNGRLIAVGYPHPLFIGTGGIDLYLPTDNDVDARADLYRTLLPSGLPIALSFGDNVLLAVTEVAIDSINFTHRVYRWNLPSTIPTFETLDRGELINGTCRLGANLIVLASDTLSGANDSSYVHFVSATDVYTYALEGLYLWGPILVDVDLDGQPEVVAFTPDGEGVYLTVAVTGEVPTFSVLMQRATDQIITSNPIAGDIDLDGRPDIIVGGLGKLHAFNASLLSKTDYPLEIDDRFPLGDVIAAPIMANIQAGGGPELIYPTSQGNFYSHGQELSYGFPLSSGEQRRFFSSSSAVQFDDSTGGKLGYLGGDGWFYAWEVNADAATNFWPMNSGGPTGSYALDVNRLPEIKAGTATFDEKSFYNYPNPVYDGQTNIRYYLDTDANSVSLNIYDLSGVEVAHLTGGTSGGIDTEVVWDCSRVATGVYRCVIKVEYPDESVTAFCDIAIIR